MRVESEWGGSQKATLMPANLTPEYKAAEAAYRRARDPQERLDLLREMLRTIPKHKGTDHLQADIKTRIKELTEAVATQKKAGARGGPPTYIHPEGAAQVALLGPPNTGKSELHGRLTGSHAATGAYPFTTQFPAPGMLPCDDVFIQLVDLPPVAAEHPVPWIANALQPSAGCMLVIDLSDPDCVDRVLTLHQLLDERQVVLTPTWPVDAAPAPADDEDVLTLRMPAVMVVNKSDQISDVTTELGVFRELTGYPYPALTVSAVTGEGLDQVGPWLFEHLGVVRVYTKVPGHPADLGRPYTVMQGQTVHDVALLVHRDIAADLKYARVWGDGSFDGQQVGPDHQVRDGDVLELHA